MAEIEITVDVDDELLERIQAAVIAQRNGDEDAMSEALWEDAQEAVIDSVRATFSPYDLVE